MIKRGIVIFLFLAAVTVGGTREALSSRVLDNGLEVIVVENHTVPLATIELVFRSGAFTESPESDGLTHLHAHMFFKANQAIPSQEVYLRQARQLGMIWNAAAREEWVHFRFTLPKDSLRAGLEFLINAIEKPLFDETELRREKEVVLGEFDEFKSRPINLLMQAVEKKLWGASYSRKSYLGSREVINAASPDQLRVIQYRYILPNNAALVIGGDVRPREVFTVAEDVLGKWDSGLDPSQAYPVPPVDSLSASAAVVVEQPVNQVQLVLAWPGPSVVEDVKATFAADVFSLIVNQRTSQLYKNLVDTGLALSVNQVYFTQRYCGPIYLRVSCRSDKLWEVHQAVLAEVRKWNQPDYFTDEQLENAKTLLEVEAVYTRDQASTYTEHVAFWWAVAGMDYYRKYFDNLRSVAREDIVAYLDRYVIGRPMVVGALVSADTRRQLNVQEDRLVP